jgi:hypothetical protein
MNTKINSSLIIAIVLLLGAGAIIYFLDMPQYQEMQDKIKKIDNLKTQKQISVSQNQQITNAEQSLQDVNWTEVSKKIDPIFTTDPFYKSKMEIYFRDIIGRSGMTLSSLSFSDGSSGVSGGSDSSKKTPAGSSTTSQTSGTTSAAVIVGSVKTNSVNITVDGTYNQMKSLLKIFEKQAYLISVKSVSFSGGTTTTTYNINAEIYSY